MLSIKIHFNKSKTNRREAIASAELQMIADETMTIDISLKGQSESRVKVKHPGKTCLLPSPAADCLYKRLVSGSPPQNTLILVNYFQAVRICFKVSDRTREM